MSEYEGFLLHKKHRAVVWILLLFGGTIACFSPLPEKMGVSSLIVGFTFLWTFILMQASIPLHRHCVGYGVSRAINRIAKKEILCEFDLALGGFTTKYTIVAWLKNFGLALIWFGVGVVFERFIPNNREVSLVVITAYCVAIANCAGTFGSMYIWLMADRKWLWYFPEDGLKEILRMHQFPLADSERIVKEARTEDLLLRSRIRE